MSRGHPGRGGNVSAGTRRRVGQKRSRQRGHPPRIEVVHLDAAGLRALAAGDLTAANQASPVPLPDHFVHPDWRETWRTRAEQVAADPASGAWITGAIWDPDRRLAVGRAGFHGPPNAAGMVEVGYAVAPDHRRQGYARAALEALLDRAAREPGVRTVRASIGPDNVASLALAAQYGFVEVGEQWDDADGLEIVFERPAGAP